MKTHKKITTITNSLQLQADAYLAQGQPDRARATAEVAVEYLEEAIAPFTPVRVGESEMLAVTPECDVAKVAMACSVNVRCVCVTTGEVLMARLNDVSFETPDLVGPLIYEPNTVPDRLFHTLQLAGGKWWKWVPETEQWDKTSYRSDVALMPVVDGVPLGRIQLARTIASWAMKDLMAVAKGFDDGQLREIAATVRASLQH